MKIWNLTPENAPAIEQVAELLVAGFGDTGSASWRNLGEATGSQSTNNLSCWAGSAESKNTTAMSGNFTRCLFAKIAGGNPRNPLICPGRFGEQTAYVWIARLRNGAASHTRPAGIFRRHESGIRHQFPRVPESRQIAEFGHQRHAGDERHAAQGLQGRDDGSPPPRLREVTQLLGEPRDPSLGLVDRVAVFLQRDMFAGRSEN